jgi:hypothetical protein
MAAESPSTRTPLPSRADDRVGLRQLTGHFEAGHRFGSGQQLGWSEVQVAFAGLPSSVPALRRPSGPLGGEGHGNCLLQNNPMQSRVHARLLVGDMSQPRGRPMMTARCSEASAAPHHGAARDTAGRDRPIPKRIGQTFSTPARRGSATSSKTSARKWPASSDLLQRLAGRRFKH